MNLPVLPFATLYTIRRPLSAGIFAPHSKAPAVANRFFNIAFLLPFLFLLLAAGNAWATSYNFTGSISTSWSNPNNWSPTGVPGAGDAVTINGIVVLDIPVTVGSVYLNGQIQGTNNLTVTGDLTIAPGPNQLGTEGDVTVGTLTWLGGWIMTSQGAATGTVTVLGAATINSDFLYLQAKTLEFNGGVSFQSGVINFRTQAVMRNKAGSTFTVNSNSATGIQHETTSSTFENQGTFIKTGTGTLSITTTNFINSGTVQVTGGTLRISTLNAFSGTYQVDVANGIEFTNAIVNNISGSGTGSVKVNGLLTLQGTNTLPGVNMASGTINGVGELSVNGNLVFSAGLINSHSPLTVSGTMTWQSGNLGFGDNTAPVSVAGLITLEGAGGKELNKKVLNCNGGLTYTGSSFTITNGAVVNIPSGKSLTNNSTLNFSGGTLTNNGTYKGTGTFSGAVFNNTGGTVAPGASPGCLVFSSGYTNGSGTLEIEIGGPTPCTEHDQLQVTGTATLGGTLNISQFGGYVPGTTTSFTILTATSVSGTFATVNYPTICGVTWSITYNATNIVVTATVTAQPEIDVQGGAPLVTIADGDITPSTTDSTDFGNAAVNGSLVRHFTIFNTGLAALTIGSITSDNAKFVVSGAPASVAASSSATFTVTFSPTATGVQNATITINNDDCDEAAYDFAVTGTGVLPGAALNFNGSNNYVDVNYNLNQSSLTLEAWVKPTSNARMYVICNDNDGNYGAGFGVNNYQLEIDCHNTFINVPGTLFSNGTWAHVAVVYQSDARVRAYVNGTEVYNAIPNAGWTASMNGLTSFSLGRHNPFNTLYYNGSIDEVRVWSRSLCQPEIQAQRNCELTGSEPGLAVYFKFNQGLANTGNAGLTTLNDLAGTAQNGTLTNFTLSGSTSNWTEPGGVASGTSCTPYQQPEIDVRGNGTSIADGDITPSTADSTDFGLVAVNGSRVRNYTIFNTGTAALSISSITSSNAKFVVSGAPTSVAAGNSATFTVTFNPTAAGAQNATITVNNDDCDEAVYDFAITGTGACPATGSIWYVNAAAASGGNGSSWACAFQNVQDAIDAATAASGHEVWVAAGTYRPTKDPSGNASPTDSRDKTFYLKTGVALYGGFNGTETLRSARNWTTNVTTLSGDIGTLGSNTDNAYHVVLSVSDANTTVLDGFTVSGGNANGSGNLSVETKTVNQNRGGGMSNQTSNPTVANCVFSQNAAFANGAGMYNNNNSGPTVSNCIFSQNTANSGGGGVENLASTSTFNDCAFLSNTANGGGGGMRSENPAASVVVNRCVFSGNTSTGTGGGFFSSANATSATLTNCLFYGNTAGTTGGAVHNVTPTMTMTNCTVSGNRSTTDGGGISFLNSNPTVKNCIVWNNRANGVTGSASSSIFTSNASPSISYSLVQNQNPSGTGNLDGTTNAANANYPDFVTPLDPANAPSTSGDFHLNPCSPAVDAGTSSGAPATDLAGNARPANEGHDLGTYEIQTALPGINVQGNAMNIADGDATPGPGNDYTDFGNVSVGGNLTRTFTIQNLGGSALTVNSISTAPNNPLFVIGALTPPSPIPPGMSADFTVTFSPTAVGVQNATITIDNNDCNETPYDFAVTGKGADPGAALNFDGTDDLVSVANSANMAFSSDFTVEAWVYPQATSEPFPTIFSKNGDQLVMWLHTGSSYSVAARVGGTQLDGAALPLNTWSHVALTRLGTTARLYLNGVLQDTKTTATPSTGSAAFTPGFWTGFGRYFKGSIDEMRVWTRALCQAEIANQKDCEMTGSETGLVAYYKFNQGFASENNSGVTTLIDAAGGDNNGTLSNFTLNGPSSNWVTPGGVTTGTSCPALTAPEANLQGGLPLVTIVDGDNTPSTADSTDFGLVAVNGSRVRNFTIFNTGNAALTVNSIVSSNALFVVSGAPTSVAAGSSASFTVTFNPTALGVQTATITINNDDCDEAVYDFAVTGKGATPAAALSFDGTNDYVSLPGTFGGPSWTELTIEAWVKVAATSSDFEAIVSATDLSFAHLQLFNAGNNVAFTNTGGVTFPIIPQTPTGQWRHVAMVVKSGDSRLYVDGVQQGSTVTTTFGNILASSSVSIGRGASGGRFLNGQMDEVRIWNTARTCDQINQLRNCELTGSEPGLVAYYKFNQGFANEDNSGVTTLTDATSGNNNGTLSGFTLNGLTSNWVTPGGVTTGTSCPAVTAPEADVRGGLPLVTIVDGDNTPSTADSTDFGLVAVNGNRVRTFTIFNTGNTALTIPSITSDNALFVVSNAPTSVAAGSSASFTVTFTPTATGTQTATITINNSDCDEAVYDFAVTGKGATPASALNFDGIDDYISTANNTTLDLSTQTVEFWAKPSGGGDNDLLVGKRNYGGNNSSDVRWSIHFQNGNQGLYFYSPAGQAVWTYAFTPNQWYHIAMVTDATSTKLYIDGTFISSKPTTINAPTNLPLIFGASGPNYEVFPGSLDEVRIWNTARTCDQISQLRNCELTGSEPGLVAYYKFNQGFVNENNSGVTTLTDATSGNLSGTLNGFALTGTSSNWVNPGAVTTGTSCPAVTVPEADVRGGSPLVTIVDGDNTPSTADSTDFGLVAVNGSRVRNFTIFNTGNAALTIPSITSDNVKFVVSNAPTSVAAGSSATFTVTFTPTATGTQTATITINNNDCDEAVYDFAVTGKGATPASALHFDGMNDNVSIPNNAALQLDQFTLETWFNPSTAENFPALPPALIAKGTAGNPDYFLVPMLNTRKIAAGFYTGTSFVTLVSTTDLAQNTWYHLAATFDGTNLKIYVNGNLENTVNAAGLHPQVTANALSLGLTNGTQYVNGALDEVRIWNVARSCEEIRQLRNCELTGSESGLVAYYKFNQGFANEDNSGVTTLTDAATALGGANDGTLSGFTLNGATSNWITPGGVSTGTSCPVSITYPEANVRGNSTDIVDGDNTPSTTDHTDFGTSAFSRIFTIFNTGNAVLNISGITVSGGNAGDFNISAGWPTSVAANSSATFTVNFVPTAAGLRTTTVHIASGDCDEADYDFAIQATAVAAKALHLDGAGGSDNVTSPVFTAFGAEPATIEFWAKNDNSSLSFPLGFSNYVFAFGGGNLTITKDFVGNYVTGATVSTGVWEHFAFTWDGISTFRAYKNGLPTPVPSFTGFSGSAATSTLRAGEPKGGYPYTGAIDEVRMWKELRTDAQILANYNTEIAGMDPCLTVYWKFNQGFVGANNSTVTTAIDAANAVNHDGTLTNFALTGSTGNWVAGSGITEVASAYIPAPEVNVKGGAGPTSITDGDSSPLAGDGTNFGSVVIGSNTTQTFTIENTGTLLLNVSGVTFTGTNAADFSVMSAPASTVAATNGTTTFVVKFAPATTGTKTAVMHINNDDCDEADYDIAIQGTATCIAPSFTTCPTNPTANVVPTTCAAPVTYTVTASGTPAPSISYAFTGATTGSGSGDGSGSSFNKGVTTVTLTASSSCAPNASCSFTVTVVDNEKPSITCAGPVTVNTTPELCTGTTVLTAPTATDNCSGVFGNALNFDGTNDYITASNVTQLSGATKLTLEAWVYPTNASTGMVMGKGTTTSSNAINIERNGQTLYFRVCGAGDSYGFANNVLPTNTWTHIACVYDGTLTGNANRLKIYINGVLQTLSFTGTIPASAPSSTAPLTVGAFSSNTLPLGASLDEVRIWNTARTQAEIQANMNSEISAQSGLAVLYHFNQGVAYANNAAVTTATDDSGNSYTGTLNNFALNGAASNWIAFSPTLSNNAPATFPKGTTTVVWTARDGSGNTQTCQQTVTVVDNQAPTLTNPGNQALNTIGVTCAANYTIADPVSDNCTGATWGYTLSGATAATVTGIADGTGSGVISFNKGETTVVLSATDGTNSATTVSFTVTVTDIGKPTISGCPGNQPLNVIAGSCEANYSIPAPVLGDNCPGPLTWNATFSGNTTSPGNLTGLANGVASSSLPFGKGATTVTLTATDAAGNTSTQTCSFVVTVTDTEKPQITCTGPVTVNTTAELCTGTATLPAPTVTDNCPFGGNGLNFDGNNDQVVSANYSGTALTGDLTLECWFKGTSMNGRTLFGRGYQQEFDLAIWSNQLNYYHGNGTTWVNPTFSYVFSDNTWYHVAVVRNATAQTVSLYVNGIFQQTLSYGAPLPVAQTAAFRIGNRTVGNFFLGSIDEVRVWTVARTPAQIAANWNQELAAQPGLFALYHLNEGSANGNNAGVTTAADASGNAKDGTLSNFALSGTTSNWVVGAFGGVTNNAPATYPKGSTTVTWTATDASGNTQTCQQTVTVVDNEAPVLANPGNQTLNTIATTCAANYTIADPVSDNCTGATWSASFSGNANGNPSNISNIADGMGSGAISFNKGVTTVVLSATDGTNSATTVSFTVTVTDNQAPTLANPGNQAFNVIAGTCAANYTIADPVSDNCAGSTWSASFSGNANGNPANISNIADGTGSGPISFNKGVTTVVLSATDGTNSATTVSFTVTVTDNQAPTISCPVNQTVPPTNTNPCSAVVNGINGNYNDNCSGSSLTYVLSGATSGNGSGQASGQTFLLGTTTVTYTVTDGANLTSSCLFTVTVTNCNITFSGTIRWEHDGTSGVANATVNLTGAGSGSGTTATNGDYLVSVPYTTGNFTLKPVKNINRLNGVTTADVTAIQQHLTNINPITNPYKLVAADINRSNSISSVDANTLNQCLLGNPAANAIFNVFWRFMPQSHNLVLPPWGFPEQIDLTGVTSNQSGKDFKGVKIGDVVSTWANPANFGAGEPLVFRVPDQVLQAGSEATAEFHADELDDLTSFQFALHFDPAQLELTAIEPLGGLPLSADNFGTYNVAEGEIRIAWAQEKRLSLGEAAPVFRLRFKALRSGMRLSEVLQLEEDALPGRVYNSAYAESGVELRYSAATGTGDNQDNREGLSLRNRPNPFTDATTLLFDLPEAGEAELRISDAAGRLLLSRKATYPAGRHEETLRLEGVSGLLFAELVTEKGSVVRKMLAVQN